MGIISVFIVLSIIAITAYLLFKNIYPQIVLLSAGIIMLVISIILSQKLPSVNNPTGFIGFDLFAILKESFSSKIAGVGLMIMTIGGYVRYMQHIGASETLVRVALKPMSKLKKKPYLATVLLLPVGHFLYMSSPSATGFSMLLMVAVYPVFVRLGVSKISAVSVITACTVFDLGPGSANVNQASSIINMDVVSYFLTKQLPVVIPTSISLMLLYYFVNRYFDKKEGLSTREEVQDLSEEKKVPVFYAVLPVLPLILLLVFSRFFKLFDPPVILNTTLAMLICMFSTFMIELIRSRDIKKSTEDIKIFFTAMGTVFTSIVTLIVCADIFSKGMIQMGFIDSLVNGSQSLGLGNTGINGIMTSTVFGSSVLMGSGSASFFAFSPLVPDIISQLGGSSAKMMLPMQLAASMGRACSSIAGVIIATSKIAGVSAFDVAKRNLIPLITGVIIMFTLDTIIL